MSGVHAKSQHVRTLEEEHGEGLIKPYTNTPEDTSVNDHGFLNSLNILQFFCSQIIAPLPPLPRRHSPPSLENYPRAFVSLSHQVRCPALELSHKLLSKIDSFPQL